MEKTTMNELIFVALAAGIVIGLAYPHLKRLVNIKANDGDDKIPKRGRPRSTVKSGFAARKAAVLTDARPTTYKGYGRPRKTDVDFR
jgi:hypothetical protein